MHLSPSLSLVERVNNGVCFLCAKLAQDIKLTPVAQRKGPCLDKTEKMFLEELEKDNLG